jgi:hypothetical protein
MVVKHLLNTLDTYLWPHFYYCLKLIISIFGGYFKFCLPVLVVVDRLRAQRMAASDTARLDVVSSRPTMVEE